MQDKRNKTDEEIAALAHSYHDRIVVPYGGNNFSNSDIAFAERWLRKTLRIDNVDYVSNKRYVGDGPTIVTTYMVGYRKRNNDERTGRS